MVEQHHWNTGGKENQQLNTGGPSNRQKSSGPISEPMVRIERSWYQLKLDGRPFYRLNVPRRCLFYCGCVVNIRDLLVFTIGLGG